MANQEVGKVQAIVNKLRVVTRVVQIAPFIYSFLYIAVMVAYMFVSNKTVRFLDTVFYTSPCVVLFLLFLSRILHLCAWHRTACILPIIPQIGVFIDLYVWHFSRAIAFYDIALTTTLFIIFLISAYKVFFVHGR